MGGAGKNKKAGPSGGACLVMATWATLLGCAWAQAETGPALPGGAQPTAERDVLRVVLPSITGSGSQAAWSESSWLALTRNRKSPYRDRALEEYGGSRETEEAVAGGLQWLAEHQQPDGAWVSSDPAIVTSAALLAFLGHDEGPNASPFGPVVAKAIDFLLAGQADKGALGSGSGPVNATAHALVALALSEAFGTTRSPALREALERALPVILEGQQDGGGWYHGYSQFKGHEKFLRRDTLVSVWQVQALHTALAVGVEVPEMSAAMVRSMKDLESIQDPETGRFGLLTRRGGTTGTTGAAVHALQLLGGMANPSTQAGLRALEDAIAPRPAKTTWSLEDAYHTTQALFHGGDRGWNEWNRQLLAELLPRQEPDGHWEAPPSQSKAGAAYASAFCTLMLETYYRYVPLGSEAAALPAR